MQEYKTLITSVSSGYGSLQSNFSQWWQRQLDMDRLRDNYHYEGAFYTWNRRSARNARPQYWDAPHYEQYQNTTTMKILLTQVTLDLIIK